MSQEQLESGVYEVKSSNPRSRRRRLLSARDTRTSTEIRRVAGILAGSLFGFSCASAYFTYQLGAVQGRYEWNDPGVALGNVVGIACLVGSIHFGMRTLRSE